VLPNMRGHYQSGRHRVDVDYIGQMEDDMADLIRHLREQRLNGPITLGGHSSGGGFAIRFAGGGQAALSSSPSRAAVDTPRDTMPAVTDNPSSDGAAPVPSAPATVSSNAAARAAAARKARAKRRF